jgi:hypothetical protein
MPKCTDVASWRAATRKERREFYGAKTEQRGGGGSALVIRSQIKPVDAYAYLRARFGEPNGFQNFLRKDDSNNLIHWDFNLKADDADVYLSGTSRTIHVHLSEKLTDEQWKDLILAFKADFRRIGREKSAMMRSFEKYFVFQNKFKSVADECALLHEAIIDTPELEFTLPAGDLDDAKVKKVEESLRAHGERANSLFGNCLKLRLLMPIMAEAYLNMVIITFCNDAIRNDRTQYEMFVRAKIPERIDLLTQYCSGFVQKIDTKGTIYGDFMRVMNLRNFSLHGNVDPIREQIETVYFEGKRPLFAEGGDHHLRYFEHLEQIYKPQEVIRDYEAVHSFLHEIASCLSQRHQEFFEQVIGDPFPGYDVHRQRVTRILPDPIVGMLFPGIRFDDELSVEWKS